MVRLQVPNLLLLVFFLLWFPGIKFDISMFNFRESRIMQENVSGGWRFWDRAIYAIYEIFCGILKMALKNEERKSKSFVSRMFGSKEKKTAMRVTKYSSEDDAEFVSGSDPGTGITQNIETLRVFVATWNVGGNPPSNDLNLDEFLQVHDHDQSDIYVLGFQEIVPLNAGNVLVLEDNEPAAKWLYLINQSLNSLPKTNSPIKSSSVEAKPSSTKSSRLVTTPTGSNFFQKYNLKAVSKQFRTESKKRLKSCSCVSELERKLYYNNKDSCFRCQSNVSEDELSSEEDDDASSGFDTPEVVSSSNPVKYGLVSSKQMVGIFLTIWAKKEIVQHVSHMRTSYVTRGIMGCLGNKGCISVSLSVYQTSFCFICSHLASGDKEGDELRRNLDVVEILKNTQFPRICRLLNTRVPDRILEHDRVIWLGDLNYRITLSYAETRKLLEKNDWDSLLSKDQLKIEIEAGRVFNGWKEGGISFAPTYKYSFNSNTYFAETNTSKHKKRTPAWCDRILWHGNGMTQVSYIRKDSEEFQFSDHRPVCSMFLVDVLAIDVLRRGSSDSNVRVEIEELLPIRD